MIRALLAVPLLLAAALPVGVASTASAAGGAAPPPQARTTDDSCPPGTIPEDGLRDADGSAHEAAIDCVVRWGIAHGTGSGSYSPAADVTRGQLATFIARTVQLTGALLPFPQAGDNPFPDDDGSVHERRIASLAQAGIVTGLPDGTYGPDRPVTRAQMATFLARAYAYRDGQPLPDGRDYFPDDDGSPHEPAINAIAQAGFTGGSPGGGYRPAATVKRDQMASFIARALDLLVETHPHMITPPLPAYTPPAPEPAQPAVLAPPMVDPSVPAGAALPEVVLAGADCANNRDGTFTVTFRWTATGGRYTDLGSSWRRTNDKVDGGTRGWISIQTISGLGGPLTTPPTKAQGRYSQLIAALDWAGVHGQGTAVLTGPQTPTAVSCPA